MEKFKYTVDPELDEVVDEKGNTAIMLRRIAWGDGTPKIEIRKWFLSETGEQASKGVTFATDKGPGNLAKTLIRKGFGETSELIGELKEREDFDNSLARVIGKQKVKAAKETVVEEYYDPKEVLG